MKMNQWTGEASPSPSFYSIEADTYHALPFVSAHDSIQLVTENPAQWKFDKANRSAPTPAMRLGEQVHCAILQPEEFVTRYFETLERPAGIDGRTKEGKAKLAEWRDVEAAHLDANKGRKPISHSDMETIRGMVKGFNEYPLAKITRSETFMVETMFLFDDPDTGVRCRGLMDGFDYEKRVIVEYKTIEKATTKAIQNTIKNFMYDVQCAMYVYAVEQLTGKAPQFVWLFQEKRQPHHVRAVKASFDHFRNGLNVVKRALEIHAECQLSGQWPAYGDKVEEFELPPFGWHLEATQL